MDVERTIEFLIKNQVRVDARMDAKVGKADQRMDRLERVVAQNNRIVNQLVRYGVSLRSDVRRIDKNLAQVTENLSKVSERLSETDGKLNALINVVDQHLRGNGQQKSDLGLRATPFLPWLVAGSLGDGGAKRASFWNR